MASPGPLTTDDRLAICDLFARYGRALDNRDLDAYVATFAPDGALDSIRRGRVEGREAIRASLQEIIQEVNAANYVHFSNHPVIEGDSERCTVRSYAQTSAAMQTAPITSC